MRMLTYRYGRLKHMVTVDEISKSPGSQCCNSNPFVLGISLILEALQGSIRSCRCQEDRSYFCLSHVRLREPSSLFFFRVANTIPSTCIKVHLALLYEGGTGVARNSEMLMPHTFLFLLWVTMHDSTFHCTARSPHFDTGVVRGSGGNTAQW